MRRNLLILCLLLLSVGAAPMNAAAQDDTVAKLEQLNAQAREKYKSRDYAGAISLFKEAYEIEPVPNLLYNIAKCHEKLKQWDDAINYYNEFVVSPDVDPKVRKETLAHVEELKKIKALEQQANTPDDKKDPDDKKGNVVEPKPEAGPDRTGAYIALGAGAALIGTGVAFGLMANSQQSTFDSATSSDDRKAARDSGTTYAMIADVGYGLGVIGLGVGAYFWLTAEDKTETAPQSTSGEKASSTIISPWFNAQGGGLLWQARF